MHQVELFRRYLLKCGHSGFPKLEKDLLFCIEVIKFRVSIFNWSLTWNVVPVVPGKSMCKEKVTYMIYQFGVYNNTHNIFSFTIFKDYSIKKNSVFLSLLPCCI